MTRNKCKPLLGLLTLMTVSTFAQQGEGYSIYDSTVISAKSMPQQNEFWNNTYNFPAKPRNMWEVGVTVGNMAVSGDVSTKIPSLGFGAHVRKAMGYVFSLRLQYINAQAEGMNWSGSQNYAKNSAWMQNFNGRPGNLPTGKGYNALVRNEGGALGTTNGGPASSAQSVFYNYKSHLQDLSLQGIITLNNVRFHKQKSGMVIYGGGGIGFTWYNAKVNALDASGNNYAALFQSQLPSSGVYKN